MAYQGRLPKEKLFTNLTPFTTKGDLIGYNGSLAVRFPIGKQNQVLTVDTQESTNLKWVDLPTYPEPTTDLSKMSGKLNTSQLPDSIPLSNLPTNIPTSSITGSMPIESIPTIPVSKITGIIPVSNGGTGVSTLTGIVIGNGANPQSTVSLVAPASGITITNPNGITGNPTFALSNDLAAVENLSGIGIAVRTANNTWTLRNLAVGTGLSITNADGVAGNPTIANTIPAGPTYTTGTFTPIAVGQTTAGTGNYTKQIGRWTRIGNRICVQVNLAWTSHTGIGNVSITGLPFPSVNIVDVNHFGSGFFFNGLLASFPLYMIPPNSSAINVVTTGSLLNLLALSASQQHQFTIWYEI